MMLLLLVYLSIFIFLILILFGKMFGYRVLHFIHCFQEWFKEVKYTICKKLSCTTNQKYIVIVSLFFCIIFYLFCEIPVLHAEEEQNKHDTRPVSDSAGGGGVSVTLLFFGSTLFLALVSRFDGDVGALGMAVLTGTAYIYTSVADLCTTMMSGTSDNSGSGMRHLFDSLDRGVIVLEVPSFLDPKTNPNAPAQIQKFLTDRLAASMVSKGDLALMPGSGKEKLEALYRLAFHTVLEQLKSGHIVIRPKVQ